MLNDGLGYIDENQIKLKMVIAEGYKHNHFTEQRSIGQGIGIHVLYHLIELHV